MGALSTDLYELNMAASYLRRGMAGPATFSLLVRHLPPERGYLVAGGLAVAAMSLARVSAIAGFAGTSNVEAARRYGLRAVGTMAPGGL